MISKTVRRMLAVSLAAVMAVGAMAGCGSKDEGTTPDPTKAPDKVDEGNKTDDTKEPEAEATATPTPVPENPFKDVVEGQYYYDPVLWAVENKVTSGLNATTFGVGNACTREQIVTFLWNFAGQPEAAQTECAFTDVNPAHYYYKAMLWAVENKITSGLNAATFGTGNACTREQIVTFLYRYNGLDK